jgi:hypothetical protein
MEFDSQQGHRISVLHSVQTGFGAYTASYTMRTGGSFPGGGVKRQGREADHSPPSYVEVKKDGAIPPLPLRLHGMVVN